MSAETPKFEPEKREAPKQTSSVEEQGRFEKKAEPVNIEEFERQVHGLVESSKDRLKDLPKSFQDSLHDNLVQYLRTSVERYDTDAEAGLGNDEFERYKSDMLQKIEEIIARYTTPREGEVEAREAAEKSTAIEIENTNFNEANLQTPQGIQQELAKFNAQSGDMHKEIGTLSESIGSFHQAHQRFEEGKKDWSVFLRGSPFVSDPATERLRTQLNDLKRTLDEKIQALREKQRSISEYGQKLNDSGDTMKRQKTAERDGKLREMEAQGTQAEQTQRKNEEQYHALETQQQSLSGQREAMADYHDDLVQEFEGVATAREQVLVQVDQMRAFGRQLEDALSTIDAALANIPPSPQREALEARKQELLGHKSNIDATVSQTHESEGQLTSAEQVLYEKRGESEGTLLTLDSYLDNTVNPGLEALSGSMQAIEMAKLQYGTGRERLEAEYAEIFQTIDEVDAAVADNVLESNLANEQVLASIETQRQSLDAISIDRPNLWNATGGLVFGKIGEGWSLLTKDVICGMLLDPASAWLKDVTKDIPVINAITEVATGLIIDFPSGIIEGAGELISGVTTMIAHPVDTIAGLGTLIGRNPQTGEWSLSSAGSAWREMGKALIAYENFEHGEIGKGLGKVALNVILTATGVGAATKGAQGASIAYSVARASSAGVTRASLRAAGTGARLFAGEFSHGIARLPGEALSVTGKFLRAPGRLLENMRLGTAGRLGKEISEMSDELSKVSKGLEDFTIGGKKVSEMEILSGKNSHELAKLSPDDLAKAGIKDAGAVREFLEYRGTLAKSERIQGSVQALSQRREIIQIAPELEAVFKLKGDGLRRFVDEFNQKHPEGFPERAGFVIDQNANELVFFNKKGDLQIIDKAPKTFSEFSVQAKNLIDAGFELHIDEQGRYVAQNAVTKIEFSPIRLPEKPWKYFKRTDTCELIDLKTVRQEHISAAGKQMKAEELMHQALAGEVKPRQPLTAVRVIDDTGQVSYVILDGNTTTSIAVKNGWSKLPVEIIDEIASSGLEEFVGEFKGLKQFASSEGKKLAYIDNNGLIELVDRYNATRSPIPKSQIEEKAFRVIHRNENGIVAINQEGRLGVYKTLEEFNLDRAKISAGKIVQPEIATLPKAETFAITLSDGSELRFASELHFQKTHAELTKLTREQLAEYGIKTESEIAAFDEYVEYVRNVENQVSKLRDNAFEAKEVLDSIMDDIASRTKVVEIGTDLIGNGSPQTGVHKAPIKGMDRTLQKCLDPLEYNGDASKLTDLARGTLEYENVTELNKAVRLIKEDPRVKKIYIKDNVGDPLRTSKHPVQYRDVNLSIQLEGGQVVELQLHIKEMLTAKEIGMHLPGGTIERMGFTPREHALTRDIAQSIRKPKLKLPADDFVKGHELYEIERAIPNNASPELLDLKYKLSSLMRTLYEEAWKQYLRNHG